MIVIKSAFTAVLLNGGNVGLNPENLRIKYTTIKLKDGFEVVPALKGRSHVARVIIEFIPRQVAPV